MSALNNGEKWITSSGRLSDFFMWETACRCGCGHNPVHQPIIDLLQEISDTLCAKVKLNCVCRCEKHNLEVGSTAKNSFHIQGMAADIAIKDEITGDDMKSELLYDAIKHIAIPMIIRYNGRHFCHIDIRQVDEPKGLSEQQGTYIPIER